MSLKERIDKVRNAAYHKDQSDENWKEFRAAWYDMTEYFWEEMFKRDPKVSDEEKMGIPTIDYLGTSKAVELYSLANHDINVSFWYHNKFDFNEFWKDTLSKICEFFEMWDEGRDDENPDTFEHLIWEGDALKKRSYSIYNIPGTSIWKRVIYVRTEEERLRKIDEVTKRLEALREREQRYVEKWGNTTYYDNDRALLNNQLDVLNRKIGNDKSMILVLKIEGA